MALIKCRECGKEISDQALSCPNCGAPTERAIKADEYLSNTVREDEYKKQLSIFRAKITRLIVLAIAFGVVFIIVGLAMPSLKAKFFTFLGWILTIIILYRMVIKYNESIIIAIIRAFAAAIGLFIIIAFSFMLAGLGGSIALFVVGAVWVIVAIGFLLYPFFDIMKDVKKLKAMKPDNTK